MIINKSITKKLLSVFTCYKIDPWFRLDCEKTTASLLKILPFSHSDEEYFIQIQPDGTAKVVGESDGYSLILRWSWTMQIFYVKA